MKPDNPGKTGKRRNFLFLMAMMLFISSASGFTGVLITQIKADLAVTDAAMSQVFFANSLGFMACNFLGGILCSRFGYRFTYWVGLGLTAASSLALVIPGSGIWGLTVFSLLQNAGLSILTISSNTVIPVVYTASAAQYMNLFHLFYSGGSAASRKLIGMLAAGGMEWRTFFLAAGAVALVLLLFVGPSRLPGRPAAEIRKRRFRLPLNSTAFWLFAGTAAAYVLSESVTTNWLVNYAWENFRLDADRGSTYLMLFFVGAAAGKLIFPPLLRRFGQRRILVLFALAACGTTLAGVGLGEFGLWLIAAGGLFFSILYPTTLSAISQTFSEDSAAVMGTIVTIASGVNMVANLWIGNANEMFGARLSYLIVPAALLVFAVLSVFNGKSGKPVSPIAKADEHCSTSTIETK